MTKPVLYDLIIVNCIRTNARMDSSRPKNEAFREPVAGANRYSSLIEIRSGAAEGNVSSRL